MTDKMLAMYLNDALPDDVKVVFVPANSVSEYACAVWPTPPSHIKSAGNMGIETVRVQAFITQNGPMHAGYGRESKTLIIVEGVK